MTTDTNLNEIREKIYELRTAIMYSMSNDVFKLPNSIVTAVHVDETGHLWFICQSSLQSISSCEKSFPVRLHFYRKGVFFHLEVSGKATIVEEAHCDFMQNAIPEKGKVVLIKMTMNAVEYTEPFGKKERNRLELFMEKGYKWVLRSIAFPHSKPALSKWQSN